jgi:ABC-type antimicrobial peptide transport system permease subunit
MLLRHYLAQGGSKSALARRLDVSRDTIHRWIRDGELDRDLDDLPVRYGPRPAAAYAKAVRETLRNIDPEVMVLSIRTMDEHVRYALYGDRLTVQLVGSMGVLGLVLAGIGLFGVISYSVARRTREIGVRIAIGANPRDVVRLVLARASLVAGVGIAVGIGLALAAARVLASAVYGVSVRDPMTYAAAAVTMAVVGLLAAAIPAHRAAAVDPLRALRAE